MVAGRHRGSLWIELNVKKEYRTMWSPTLNDDVLAVVLDLVEDSCLLVLCQVDSRFHQLSLLAMLDRVVRRIGREPRRLERAFSTYRQAGTPCVFDSVANRLVNYDAISNRRDIRKVFESEGRLFYIDVDDQCGYIDERGTTTLLEWPTRDAMARTHGRGILRVVGDSIVHETGTVAKVRSCKQLVSDTYDDNHRVCSITKDNQLAISDRSLTTVICPNVKRAYIADDWLPEVYVITEGGGVYSGPSCGALRQHDLHRFGSIEKYYPESAMMLVYSPTLQRIAIKHGHLCIPSTYARDIIPVGSSRVAILLHDAQLVLYDVADRREVVLDTNVISLTGDRPGRYLCWIRRPS
jgi:hypothetical protein